MMHTLSISKRNRADYVSTTPVDDCLDGAIVLAVQDFASREQSNQYRAFLANPISKVDPLGLEAATTQPKPPGDGEHWIDPGNHGIGIYGGTDPNGGANCIGAACGIPKNLGINHDENWIPKGCQKIDKIPEKPECPDDNTVYMWVSVGVDNKDKKTWSTHVVYFDNKSVGGASTKLGAAPGDGEGIQNSGAWVRGITNVDEHIKWYQEGTDSHEVFRHCFKCDRSKMEVDPKTGALK